MSSTPDNDGSLVFLSESDLDDLPYGTEVVITWSGGNGPHNYRVHRTNDQPYAVPSRQWDVGPDGTLWFYNPITFVGDKPFHTRVSVRV